jgi:Bacterial PH domain
VAKDELRADIAAARARMRTKVGGGKEIKRLVGHLWEDEHVERMTTGSYGAGTGLLVLTDRRLLFVKEGMTKKTEDFPLENISSVQWSSGLTTGTVTVFASGNKAEIKSVNKADGKEMTDHLRHRLSVPKAAASSHWRSRGHSAGHSRSDTKAR